MCVVEGIAVDVEMIGQAILELMMLFWEPIAIAQYRMALVS